jgi:lipid II:glycine glycyltransferase (peptidoglycan interpeptide bridge formation enzyme)
MTAKATATNVIGGNSAGILRFTCPTPESPSPPVQPFITLFPTTTGHRQDRWRLTDDCLTASLRLSVHEPREPELLQSRGTNQTNERTVSRYGIADSFDTLRWDQFVERLGGDLTQHSGWVRAKGSTYRSEIVTIHGDNDTSAGALILHRRVKKFLRIGYISGGPLVAEGNEVATEAIVRAVVEAARRLRLAALLVAPPADSTILDAALAGAGFTPSPFNISPAATVRVDLTPSIDQILARLPKSRRRAIRQAKANGVTVREGGESDLATLHRLHCESAAAQRFEAQPLAYLERQWAEFASSGMLRMFIAEQDGIPIAADLLAIHGTVVVDKLGGSRRSDPARHQGVNELLQWHMISWAQAAGHLAYDFGGLHRHIAEQLLSGTANIQDFSGLPDFFKLHFGGTPMLLMPTRVYCSNLVGRWVLRVVGSHAARPGFVNRQLGKLRS